MVLFLSLSILYLLIGSSFIFWLVLSFSVCVVDCTLLAGYTLFVGSSTTMVSVFADFPFSCLTFLELVCETSCFYTESLQDLNWTSVDYLLLGPDIFDLGLLFFFSVPWLSPSREAISTLRHRLGCGFSNGFCRRLVFLRISGAW